MHDFKGKVILVTGAGAGIGKAIAQTLVKSGAQVIAVSLVQDELTQLAQELPGTKTIQVDLRNWSETRKALENVGRVDGLVNNAGVASIAPFLEATEEQYNLTFDVNVKAIINVSQIIAKSMIANGIKGSIVNISSVAALTALNEHAFYCASKSAVDGLTRSMALEFGVHGIRVNSVNPTVVMTELGQRVWADPAKQEKLLSRLPLGRFAQVTEIVQPILFLLSNDSSMVTGETLRIDGGYNSA